MRFREKFLRTKAFFDLEDLLAPGEATQSAVNQHLKLFEAKGAGALALNLHYLESASTNTVACMWWIVLHTGSLSCYPLAIGFGLGCRYAVI